MSMLERRSKIPKSWRVGTATVAALGLLSAIGLSYFGAATESFKLVWTISFGVGALVIGVYLYTLKTRNE